MGPDGTIEVTTRIEVEVPPAAAPARPEIELPTEFRNVVLTTILAIIVFYTLYLARAVFVPVLLAILLRLFLQLPMNFLTRHRVPNIVAVLIVMVGLFGGLGLLGSALGGPAADWIAKAPTNFSRMKDRLEFIKRPVEELQGFAHRIDSILVAPPSPNTSTVTLAGPGLGGFVAANTQSLVRGIGTVVLLLFFLLAAGDTFKRRLVEILPRLSDKKQAVEIVNEIEGNISGYLLSITVINAGLGILTGLAFYFCGMPAAALWGTIAFCFNYVPFVGPFCAIVIFFMAGLFTFDSNWLALLPVGIYIVLILAEGQVVTPTVLARRFSLNPVAVIVSLIFWFWMWGTPGALLAVPMLAAFKIVCDHVRPLTAIGHLLEG
ncbi:MAG TPA: AI-2E family transporter [Stellaceae bacterium]|jgi:predicted PurR-regulated permease PerM|nr:AI-2E family transporter [Stellaceae bacterium]